VHAVSQQLPSTQWPLVHWSAAAQTMPAPTWPLQTPLAVSQYLPLPQSVSIAHAAHVLPLQTPL